MNNRSSCKSTKRALVSKTLCLKILALQIYNTSVKIKRSSTVEVKNHAEGRFTVVLTRTVYLNYFTLERFSVNLFSIGLFLVVSLWLYILKHYYGL